MATERMTTRDDGTTSERVVERDGGGTTYVDRGGGSGIAGIIIGLAILALVAIGAVYLLNANRNDALRTDAVTSAASSVANSTSDAAKSVGNAANNAADSVGNAAQSANPNR